VIVDCHGHYTTVPEAHRQFRAAQLGVGQLGVGQLGVGQLGVAQLGGDEPAYPEIPDDEIRATIEQNQLRVMDERGIDLTILSPQASAMEHHVPDAAVAAAWARACNDLVFRVTELFPARFAGVCQLPQTPDGNLDACAGELRRCVEELGFVGCNLNPDPSGGHWTAPPLTDESWFPLYEAMTELEVPAMVHVSSSCTPAAHTLGAHYLNADTSVFMQLLEGDLFARFPGLRFVIPHGGGAVPYHWGRYRGLADRLGRPPLDGHVMQNVFFDTCVYHQAGIDLLGRVIDVDNILFASEMLGAVRGVDPESGHHWDDTKRYVDALPLPDEDKRKVFELNARRVYPRLDARLTAAGR
jgi:4-oxalmesaconate hydratase